MNEKEKKRTKKSSKLANDKEAAYVRSWYPFMWIFGIGILLYAQTLFFDLTGHDDIFLINSNYEFNKDISNVSKIFFEDVFRMVESKMYYRPLYVLTFMIDAQLGGTSPAFYHLTNVILHLIASSLVFVFLGKLFGNRKIALFWAILFTIHPIQLQTVAWIPGRGDSMLCIFVILTLLTFLEYQEKKSWKIYCLNLLWLFLAFYTKETAIVLPVLLVGYLFIYSRQNIFSRNNLMLYAGWLIVILPWYFLRESVAYNARLGGVTQLWDFVYNNLGSLPLFFGKVIFPINLSTYPILQDANYLYGFLSIAAVTLLLIVTNKRDQRLLWLGGGWFMLFLLPSLVRGNPGIVPEFCEHRVYISTIGLFLMLGSIDFSRFKFVSPQVRRNVAVVLVLILFVMNFVHAGNYKDSWNYWQSAAAASPNATMPHQSLGDLYMQNGMYTDALNEFQKAANCEPNRHDVHYDLGVTYDRLGYLKEAEQSYRKAIQIYPKYFDAYQNLAVNLDKQGATEEASVMFGKALELNPQSYELHNNYGIHLSKRNLLTDAEREFRQAISLNPQYGNAHLNLGYLFYALQEVDSANKHFTIARQLGSAVPEEFFAQPSSLQE